MKDIDNIPYGDWNLEANIERRILNEMKNMRLNITINIKEIAAIDRIKELLREIDDLIILKYGDIANSNDGEK